MTEFKTKQTNNTEHRKTKTHLSKRIGIQTYINP